MRVVTVIALGSRTACDDEAALLAAERLQARVGARARIVLAGRPGPGLVDLLDPAEPTVLLDVIAAGLAPGEVLAVPLRALPRAVVAGRSVSSHGLGPAEALRLAGSLGRALPEGTFVGIEGARLTPGAGMHPAVRDGIEALVERAAAAVHELSEGGDPCTSRG